jgi:glucose dehydrogenase
MAEMGQSETPNHVRSHGGFPRKRSPGAGDGCIAKYDTSYRPGDNLFTNSALAIDAATGRIKWFHQYTPNDSMDYDEIGTHILIDGKVNGEDRKLQRWRQLPSTM